MKCAYARDCSECNEIVCKMGLQPPADPYDPYYYPYDLYPYDIEYDGDMEG